MNNNNDNSVCMSWLLTIVTIIANITMQAEVCTPEHENLWSVQNYKEPIELNEEQKLLQILLEKYS